MRGYFPEAHDYDRSERKDEAGEIRIAESTYLNLFSLDRIGGDDPAGGRCGGEGPGRALECPRDVFSEHGGCRDGRGRRPGYGGREERRMHTPAL